MGSAAARLADSPSIERWPGAITVFAAPDIFLRASCPGCSRRQLLLEHMALGYFPYSDLAGVLAVGIPSASIGLCLNITAARTPFTVRKIGLSEGFLYPSILAEIFDISLLSLESDKIRY